MILGTLDNQPLRILVHGHKYKELPYNKSMEKTVQILINSIREEIRNFVSERNGPKEEQARDEMIINLFEAANDAELDIKNEKQKRIPKCPDGMIIDEKGRVWRELVPGFIKPEGWTMSSAEITAEAEAKYGHLHN